MDAKTQHGYLVIADISGFTSYLAKVELEHAHEILTDMLETIVKEFKTLLTISKLEGDAVFAYVPQVNTLGGERLLELIENTYVAFRRQREASRKNTTCTCNACQSIPTLDLKFFIHHGDYIVQQVSGIRELVSSDVNLIHRLMKNHVTENTDWNAYVLFTQRAFQNMSVQPEGLHEQLESYEHLGEIQIYCLDLHARYKALVEARRIFISPEEADFSFTYDFQAPPPVVWHWITDPQKKTLVVGAGSVFTAKTRPGGRIGPGATNHCAHGKNLKKLLVETILDWRPFDYLTQETINGKMVFRDTYKLESLSNNQGTRLHMYTNLVNVPLPQWIKRLLLKIMVSKFVLSNFQNTAQLIAEEMTSGAEDTAIQPVASSD